MKNKELARLFFREVLKIQHHESLETAGKIQALYRLLNQLFVQVTQEEKLQFTTMFARISFACQKRQVAPQTQFYIHAFRKAAIAINLDPDPQNLEKELLLGLKVTTDSIVSFFNEVPPQELAELVPTKIDYKVSPVAISDFKSSARVVALGIDTEKEQLIIRDEDYPTKEIRAQYNIAERNANYNPTIKAIQQVFNFPITINLIDVEIDTIGIYRPRAFVVEPDYLVDVSAVAECFKDFGALPIFNFLKKYLPFSYTKYLMIGNIANFFLDELMTNPEATFKDTFPKVFRLNPLAFVTFENSVVREIMQTSQKHFLNLKRMVQNELANNNISPEECYLEPSFYSQKYGLQGRLDVFYKNPNGGENSAIVELKSGKTYKPNIYGINQNHFVQTLLYDLIVKSVFGKKLTPANYILYSGVDERQLRFAPTVKAQQMEALQLRNQLVAIEYQLASNNTHPIHNSILFNQLNPGRWPQITGFLKRDLALFDKVYRGMSELERKYFHAFSGFIAREHQLAKTGVQGVEKVNGLAALWLNDFKEKEDSFEILSYLELKESKAKEDVPIIIFEKSEKTNPLANFRKGDISVLYPFKKATDTVLNNQIFKCTIVRLSKTEVQVQLRSRQFNDAVFQQNVIWNIEHDMMDSSFRGMYQGLFQFAQFPSFKKELLLTLTPPQEPEPIEIKPPSELTEEQKHIFQRALAAKDYFLLWGPPGTGKTSKMLKNMVSYLLNETDENVLLLAYTNRAVDEICEAIESIDDFAKKEYLRIGSSHSTGSKFREQLFQTKIEKVSNRKELKEVIESHRVFVSTVASISGKLEILQLKTFHRVIIDEASQIPEPMLVGLLPYFKRFLLIGDHKQLPAVVVQSPEASKVQDEALHQIGLYNLRDSLFERMYKRCLKNDWHWAFSRLSQQGRMHEEIMNFPSQQFYEGFLQPLPRDFIKNNNQTKPVDFQNFNPSSKLEHQLFQNRLVFLSTPVDEKSITGKTNEYEAKLIGEVVAVFQNVYQVNNLSQTSDTIGIITPYRAQIAQIRQALYEKNIDTNLLTIDTVERYQGGARDIILISLCTNRVSQLEALVSLSDEGVDRKLNVALTRARQHLVLIGNPDILKTNDIYASLIQKCEKQMEIKFKAE